MKRRRWIKLAGCVAVAWALGLALRAEAAGVMPDGADAFVKPRPKPIDERALVEAIDRMIAAKWQTAGATPAARSRDA